MSDCLCCPFAVSPSLLSDVEAAAEEELVHGTENDETGLIGIDDGYDRGNPEMAMDGGNGSDDLVCGECSAEPEQAQKARGMRDPKQPSADDLALHNLTHFPYRSWCPHCVSTRRPDIAHRSKSKPRTTPLLVADYGYIRDKLDQDLLTVLVVRVYPFKMTFAMVCDVKGYDEEAVRRLSDFIKQCGLHQFSYRSDQEASLAIVLEEAIKKSSLTTLVEEAVKLSGRQGVPAEAEEAILLPEEQVIVAPPELSSVGQSQ